MSRVLLASSAIAAAALSLGLGGGASETIALTGRPTILRGNQPITLSGSVGSGKPDLEVTIHSLPCDQTTWRELAATTTQEGGGWSIEVRPGITATLRATADSATSNTIKVQQRPWVQLGQRPPGTFEVGVNAQRPFWHKRAILQKFDEKTRTWRDVRSVLLTDTDSPPGVSWIWTSSDKFRAKFPKRTLLRATLPLSQARPCYLGGYSNLLRT